MKREAARSITAVSVAAALTIQTAMPAAIALAQETTVAPVAPVASYAQETEVAQPVVTEAPGAEVADADGLTSAEGEQQTSDEGVASPDASGAPAASDESAPVDFTDAPAAADSTDAPAQGEETSAVAGAPAEGGSDSVDADSLAAADDTTGDAAKPVPGADAPTSPTDDSMATGGDIHDFLTQEEIDAASVSTYATRKGETTFASMLVFANQYRGLPYVWGGKDYDRDGGFDCSGFVIWVLDNVAGLDIDGDMVNAADLYENYCTPVSREEAQPGDLVFFKGTYGGANYISHVGLYCGNGVMIDAGNPINYHSIDAIRAEGGAKAPIVFGRVKGLTFTQTSAAEGWRSENSAMYFYENGKKVTGEKEIYGHWYYFDPEKDGAMATGFVRLTGAYLANGPKTVYYDDNGCMVEGERQIGGHWYYFGPGGAMATGFVRLTGAYLASGPKTVYYDEQGRMVTGTRTIGGVTCRFDAGSGALVSPAMSYSDAVALGSAKLSYVSHSVPTVNQMSEGAVMGCEGASLYMALRGAGALGGTSFASFLNTMPLAFDDNPNHGFVGSPWAYEEDTGIYQSIYPAALASWGSRYGTVKDISGTSTLGLASQLQAGKNIVVYVTADYKAVQWKSYFFGNAVNNAHVMTLIGFDPSSGKFQVADPKYGTTYWIDWATFDAAYSAQRFAVAVG